ncbi:MAG: hypothetical protein NTY11_02810 [Candidatus Parcubacteria bacterium]|nr:hypothetical protein [Candidatus Parcubacteria bacterium]
MQNKIIIIISIAVIIVVGGLMFYGGMKYGQGKSPTGFGLGNFQNLTPEQRQQRMAAGTRGSRVGTANFISGEVIAQDDKSVTIKLQDGGSKIIFYSNSIDISKTVAGTIQDLTISKTILVDGTANQDGSVTANSIQVRPQNPVNPTQ